MDDSICRICGGPLCFLGTLGQRDWFRCQACGLDQSRAAEETGEWVQVGPPVKGRMAGKGPSVQNIPRGGK